MLINPKPARPLADCASLKLNDIALRIFLKLGGRKGDDLEHPFTDYEITDFLKDNDYANYKKFSMILLKTSDHKFNDYEKRKYQYEIK